MNFVERPNTSSLCALNHRVAHLLITRFGVLTAILIKMQDLRDFTPCRLVISYVSKDLCIHRQGKIVQEEAERLYQPTRRNVRRWLKKFSEFSRITIIALHLAF
jgi:hypothetical protein